MESSAGESEVQIVKRCGRGLSVSEGIGLVRVGDIGVGGSYLLTAVSLNTNTQLKFANKRTWRT